MKKLELKYVVGYLPYELKVCFRVLDLKNGDPTTENLDDRMKDCFMILKPSMLNELDFKPVLRPLSDVTKEIEEDFNIYSTLSLRSKNDFDSGNPLILKWSFEDIQKLLEQNFDVFGLIDEGLAISYNDLQ